MYGMVAFEFDPNKAAANVAKHGVSFELAQAVWDDPLHVIVPDRMLDGERRYHAIGTVGHVVVLVVVHMYPNGEDEDRVRIIGARRAPGTRGSDMKKMQLSEALQSEADRLADLSDASIDTSDIPEASAAAWRNAVRPGLYRPVKQPVTLRLDADVVAWFKDHAAGSGYQTAINDVLRRHVAAADRDSRSATGR